MSKTRGLCVSTSALPCGRLQADFSPSNVIKWKFLLKYYVIIGDQEFPRPKFCSSNLLVLCQLL